LAIKAGELSARVDIQRKILQQHPLTGTVKPVWQNLYTDVPAKIEYRSGKEYIAAHAVQSEITCLITVRYRSDLHAAQRIVQKATAWRAQKIFNVHAVLPDTASGLERLTMPCSEGVDQG
jgi:SPP1 family predicted phage head-tail adaptor